MASCSLTSSKAAGALKHTACSSSVPAELSRMPSSCSQNGRFHLFEACVSVNMCTGNSSAAGGILWSRRGSPCAHPIRALWGRVLAWALPVGRSLDKSRCRAAGGGLGDTFQRPLLPSAAALPGLDSPTILACLHVKCSPWTSMLACAPSSLRKATSLACLLSTSMRASHWHAPTAAPPGGHSSWP